MEVRLRACSTALGDPVDSYLLVGTGALRLVLDEAWLRQQAAAARTRQQLESLVRKLSESMQLDYAQFSSLAGRPAVPGSSVKGNVRSRLELSFAPKGGVVRCCLIRATEEPLEPPEPGARVGGEPLDGLVRALVGAARAELDGELLDVDEVRELERVSAQV